MLVLSRQRDESIMLGDDIEVTVVDIRGDRVRLGINAPRNISVHRKEVYEQIRRETRHEFDLTVAKKVDVPQSQVNDSEKRKGLLSKLANIQNTLERLSTGDLAALAEATETFVRNLSSQV